MGIMAIPTYTFPSFAHKACPPTPRRPILCAKSTSGSYVRVAKNEQTQSLRYKNEGVGLGNLIGEGTFAHVYQDFHNSEQVIKIPHFMLGPQGVKHFEEAHAVYYELLNCPAFHATGMSLVPTTIHYVASEMAYLKQKYFSCDTRFSVEMHMEGKGVFETLKTLFQLCYDGDLPPIDLTPSNLIYIDGMLALIDWHIPYDDDVPVESGAQFRLHMQSRLDTFGPMYRTLLRPQTKETECESSGSSVIVNHPPSIRLGQGFIPSLNLLELLKNRQAAILPDQGAFTPRKDEMEFVE